MTNAAARPFDSEQPAALGQLFDDFGRYHRHRAGE
jgi:hypothetical protein